MQQQSAIKTTTTTTTKPIKKNSPRFSVDILKASDNELATRTIVLTLAINSLDHFFTSKCTFKIKFLTGIMKKVRFTNRLTMILFLCTLNAMLKPNQHLI